MKDALPPQPPSGTSNLQSSFETTSVPQLKLISQQSLSQSTQPTQIIQLVPIQSSQTGQYVQSFVPLPLSHYQPNILPNAQQNIQYIAMPVPPPPPGAPPQQQPPTTQPPLLPDPPSIPSNQIPIPVQPHLSQIPLPTQPPPPPKTFNNSPSHSVTQPPPPSTTFNNSPSHSVTQPPPPPSYSPPKISDPQQTIPLSQLQLDNPISKLISSPLKPTLFVSIHPQSQSLNEKYISLPNIPVHQSSSNETEPNRTTKKESKSIFIPPPPPPPPPDSKEDSFLPQFTKTKKKHKKYPVPPSNEPIDIDFKKGGKIKIKRSKNKNHYGNTDDIPLPPPDSNPPQETLQIQSYKKSLKDERLQSSIVTGSNYVMQNSKKVSPELATHYELKGANTSYRNISDVKQLYLYLSQCLSKEIPYFTNERINPKCVRLIFDIDRCDVLLPFRNSTDKTLLQHIIEAIVSIFSTDRSLNTNFLCSEVYLLLSKKENKDSKNSAHIVFSRIMTNLGLYRIIRSKLVMKLISTIGDPPKKLPGGSNTCKWVQLIDDVMGLRMYGADKWDSDKMCGCNRALYIHSVWDYKGNQNEGRVNPKDLTISQLVKLFETVSLRPNLNKDSASLLSYVNINEEIYNEDIKRFNRNFIINSVNYLLPTGSHLLIKEGEKVELLEQATHYEQMIGNKHLYRMSTTNLYSTLSHLMKNEHSYYTNELPLENALKFVIRFDFPSCFEIYQIPDSRILIEQITYAISKELENNSHDLTNNLSSIYFLCDYDQSNNNNESNKSSSYSKKHLKNSKHQKMGCNDMLISHYAHIVIPSLIVSTNTAKKLHSICTNRLIEHYLNDHNKYNWDKICSNVFVRGVRLYGSDCCNPITGNSSNRILEYIQGFKFVSFNNTQYQVFNNNNDENEKPFPGGGGLISMKGTMFNGKKYQEKDSQPSVNLENNGLEFLSDTEKAFKTLSIRDLPNGVKIIDDCL